MYHLLKRFVAQVTPFVQRLNLLRIIQSSSLLRYTLLHTAIVVALCGTLLWGVQNLSLGSYEQQQHRFIQEQLHALSTVADSNSETNFIEAVEALAEKNRQALVVLSTDSGYFGNLNYLPDSVPLSPATGKFWILGDSVLGKDRLQEVQGSRKKTRWGTLLVAYNSSDFNFFEIRFSRIIYLAMFLALAIGLASGFLFSRKVLSRLNQINRITAQVGEGKLKARVPVTGKGDEFDTLSVKINDMLASIENSVEATASVTNSIAHDLRTPLSRLRIRLDEHLRKGQANSEELLVVQSELDTVLHTFTAMLELNKLEHGQRQITFTYCHLEAICHGVLELAEPLAENRGQRLRLDIQSSLTVEGNKELLFRSLFNLVENAVKYAPADSEVVIRVKDNAVAIIDQGKGIPEAEQEKVFRRLYRLDQSRTTPGHGLGLSLVQAVANLHGAKASFNHTQNGFEAVIQFESS